MDKTYLKSSETLAYPGNQHLPGLFADCVRQYPLNTALKFDEQLITYHDLNKVSNQLANFLIQTNVTIDSIVGIALDRSPEMLITLLAILKTGAAYLPLDPEYPKDRVEFMLSDSASGFLITSKKHADRFGTTAKKILIEDIWPTLINFPDNEPHVNITGQSLAYILYTSGSTGKPKGVIIEHHSLANLLLSVQKTPGITHTDILLAVTTISFDIAALELFLPLISGATVIITGTETTKDPRALLKVIKNQNVSIMQATPNTWRMMLESGWNEKLSIKVLCGGEALTKALADKLVANCTSLWNMYGPTETTIWSTLKQVLISDGIITVGQPIDHTDIFILDENGQQLPAGSPGEICIGGAGLARGYLNRADLTGEKFITYEVADHKKLKLYKTGDLGKLLPNNELQCLGRIDHQVKIRGFRIELGEIEAVIQNSGLVSEAVVITREDEDSNKNLVGYVIPSHIQVKLKEKELYKKQVENWEKVYDAEYDKSENTLQTNETVQFNTNIWTDSFTIKTIPTEQMQEWLTDIIRVILAEKPKNILEIGCGTGLIFYQIAPYLDKYIGTDLSRSGINALEKEISKGAVQYPETKLMVCGAHEIELAAEEVIDTIIFNSVIQYFPGEDYLSEVLAKSIPLLNGVGKIIIGDVRDLQTLKLFKSSLALLKLPADVDKKEFLFTADQELLKEEELCVAPGYFYNLRTIYPEITHIDIQWKQAEYINELIAYRYTVVIYVGIKNKVLTPEWIKWSDIVDKDFIKQTIENKPPLIALCDVPNHRLSKQALLDQAIGDSSLYTTGDILNYISKPNNEYLEASQIINLAKANGYHLSFFVNSDPLKLNLLLQLDQGVQFIQPHNDDVLPVERYVTNIPLLSTICTTIQRDIYKTLLAQLPNYMIPASLTMVSQLPLTNNGKTDRQFLMQRSSNDRIPPATYRAARNNVEKRLIEIWQEFLSIDKIGINDNFFELGGNSLIAIRIMITLEKDTGKDLPLSSLFEYPTIEQLASIVQNTGTLNTSKCLVRLKHGGSKTPLYIVHGWGLTVFLFKDLANNLHADQPVFALQGIGIDGFEEPLTKTEDIAARYLSEVLVQNPTGPYSFAGYSLGGVIACEMVKQLRIMGKEVTMLAMFDAYAHTVEKKANITLMAFSLRKMQKFFLRISHNLTQLIKDPNTLNEKLIQINRKLPSWIKKNNILKLQKENDVDFYSNDLSKIYFAAAVQNYKLTANEDIIELFRGSKNIYYYMDDPVYLGWREYAKTVNLYRLKGSHTTMFLPPNDKQFAEVLQQCLDKANS